MIDLVIRAFNFIKNVISNAVKFVVNVLLSKVKDFLNRAIDDLYRDDRFR